MLQCHLSKDIAEDWLLEAEQKNKQPQATDLQKALITASQEFRSRLLRQDEERQQRELEAARKIAQESAARVKQERRTLEFQPGNDFNDLMRLGCDWVRDYLKYNAPKSDRTLCDGINRK